MVFFTRQDRESAVYLLQEDGPDHLVGEGHGWKWEFKPGFFEHLVGQAKGAADDKGHVRTLKIAFFGYKLSTLLNSDIKYISINIKLKSRAFSIMYNIISI